ncbi:MAG: ABC-F family ATP-binding cassette domain-containing protein [Ignavibacteriae bacterium]|nr:ABC-F family ATP-binding cassette domain-containing protein [Ignavibacteriota bacterium]
MIAAVNIALQFGERCLLDDVTFHIGPHDRIGLVGSNGAGKSTLLRILLGENTPDTGVVTRAKYVTVGYLPQEGPALTGRTLYTEVESVFADIIQTQRDLTAVQEAMAKEPPESDAARELLEIYGELQHKLEASDSFRIQSAIEKVLIGLGFTATDFPRLTEEFSGGWQMRIALAKLLLQQPSLLLLDEPTNHLDLDSLEWLEEYLQTYEGAVMIVSHDRRFLDTMTKRTFELTGGELIEYAGNYTFSMKAREERRIHLEAAWRNQQQQIKQTERFIERFRYKATKARQVQSRIKALDKIERVELEDDENEIRFSFPPAPSSGRVVMTLKGIVKHYDALEVFNGVDFEVDRGDRIAFVGVNGAGKSTLARIIAGVEPYDSGERLPGHNVSVSYFAQHQAEELNPSFDVLQTVESVATGDIRTRLRSLLGSFLFTGDDVFKKVSVLSGGEKSRLALAKMLLVPSNLIVLDEPTNHLDMRSKAVLQEALAAFEGCLIVVSHDRDFLDPLVTKVVEFRSGSIRTYLGSVSEYLASRHREATAAASSAAAQQPQALTAAVSDRDRKRREAEIRQERYKKVGPLQKKLAVVEKAIAALEAEKAVLEETMADVDLYKGPEKIREVNAAYKSVGDKLQDRYHEWGKVSEELERLMAHYDAEMARI